MTEAIYCRREGARFDETEFVDDPQWGRVHKTDYPHTTMGAPVNEGWDFQDLGGA